MHPVSEFVKHLSAVRDQGRKGEKGKRMRKEYKEERREENP